MVRAILIESNPTFRQTLRDIFDSHFSSVELTVAANGANAMEKMQTFPPDLVFIDIKLPGEDSLDLTRNIKECYRNAVVIIIGSYDSPEYREAACRHGADYFISKDSPLGDYFSLIRSVVTDHGLLTGAPNRGYES
jgi:two-component system, response regulator YesN